MLERIAEEGECTDDQEPPPRLVAETHSDKEMLERIAEEGECTDDQEPPPRLVTF
jgi:hypothetical protein